MAMRRLRVGLQSVYQPASEKKAGGRSHPIMSSYASSTPREHVNLDEPYRPKPLGEKSHGPPKNSILVDVDTTPTTPKLQHVRVSFYFSFSYLPLVLDNRNPCRQHRTTTTYKKTGTQ